MNLTMTNIQNGAPVTDTLNVAGESILLEAIDRLPVGVGVEKPNGELTHCNQAFAAYYRVPARLLIGMDFMDRMGIICPQIVEVNGQPVIGTGPLAAFHTDPCMRHDAPGTIETRLRDGRSYLNERADLSNGGRVIVMTDVTALKRAEVEARAFSSLHKPASASPHAATPSDASAPESCTDFGACRLDLASARLYGPHGQEIPVTAMEFSLLRVFAENRGRILTRDQLLELAHDKSWEPFDRSIDLRISRLRRKIEVNPAKPQVIRTVRGLGYILS